MAAAAEAADPVQQKIRKAGKPNSSQPRRQRLEVPRESPLVKQLRLDDPAADSAAVPLAQRPTIGAPSTSDLLGRLQQFLPAMQSANAQLATAPATDAAPAALDIKFREDDSTDEDSDDSAAEPHIVMDLACGVFDLKDEAAMAAAARQMSGAAAELSLPGVPDEAPTNSSSSSSSANESDDESGDGVSAAAPLDTGSAGQTAASGMRSRGAQQHDGASGKGKRRRGRHQGIQEL